MILFKSIASPLIFLLLFGGGFLLLNTPKRIPAALAMFAAGAAVALLTLGKTGVIVAVIAGFAALLGYFRIRPKK